VYICNKALLNIRKRDREKCKRHLIGEFRPLFCQMLEHALPQLLGHTRWRRCTLFCHSHYHRPVPYGSVTSQMSMRHVSHVFFTSFVFVSVLCKEVSFDIRVINFDTEIPRESGGSAGAPPLSESHGIGRSHQALRHIPKSRRYIRHPVMMCKRLHLRTCRTHLYTHLHPSKTDLFQCKRDLCTCQIDLSIYKRDHTHQGSHLRTSRTHVHTHLDLSDETDLCAKETYLNAKEITNARATTCAHVARTYTHLNLSKKAYLHVKETHISAKEAFKTDAKTTATVLAALGALDDKIHLFKYLSKDTYISAKETYTKDARLTATASGAIHRPKYPYIHVSKDLYT